MDMSVILSHCKPHKPAALIEADGTCTVAEYLNVLLLQYL